MNPSIGRIVIARGPAAVGRSADECPAIITCVWPAPSDGAALVNATLFPDGAAPGADVRGVTSVRLYADEAAAAAALTAAPHTTVLHWPARA